MSIPLPARYPVASPEERRLDPANVAASRGGLPSPTKSADNAAKKASKPGRSATAGRALLFDHLGSHTDENLIRQHLKRNARLGTIYRALRDRHPHIGPTILLNYAIRISEANGASFSRHALNRVLRLPDFEPEERSAVRAHQAHRNATKTAREGRTTPETTLNTSEPVPGPETREAPTKPPSTREPVRQGGAE